MPRVTITDFTDPGCPFACSAEPIRLRLAWIYGPQIDWRTRIVGLAESPATYEDSGFTVERLSKSLAGLSSEYHMPIDTSLRPRMAATVPACRAVIAARLNAPSGRRRSCAGYEVAIANALPDADRREAPDTVEEVLRWAGTPLATQEVAAICELEFNPAREALGRVAVEQQIGWDGFWTLA